MPAHPGPRAASATLLRAAALVAALGAIAPAPSHAQDGAGSTGATVLQLPAGSRAAALAGAYAAVAGDADVLFYNPAGAAGVGAAASLAYERRVVDIVFGSAAGALGIGPVVLGLAVTYLDAGEVEVIEPDPDYGGQRGRETGETVGASESAARLAVAVPLGGVRLGAALGVVTSNLAGLTRSAPFVDLGAQFEVYGATVGAALRNLGGALSGDDAVDAPLPSEARLGVRFERARATGLGFTVGADLASDLRAGTTWLAGGVEAGLLPGVDRHYGAVARLSLDSRDRDDALRTLRLGAGITLDRLGFDYTYQEFEHFGGIHRIGIRWSRPPR
ncbi:MAG TPA: hypothetical protein VF212_15685 [Longimicrobiales bacterium]